MEAILLKDVRRLGQVGDVKRVADGYARNYLIPRGLAVPVTESARQEVAQRVAAAARQAASEEVQAEAQAADLHDIELVFTAKAGESGRLYGSITNADIAERLSKKIGAEVDKRKVLLENPIKQVGKSKVEVKLHPNVKIEITVIVEAKESL